MRRRLKSSLIAYILILSAALVGCGSATPPDLVVMFSFGSLAAESGETLYYYDGTEAGGIYKDDGESVSLFAGLSGVSAIAAGSEYLYAATSSGGFTYDTLHAYPLGGGEPASRTFPNANFTALLSTENGLYALSSFCNSPGYSDANNTYLFFDGGGIEEEALDIMTYTYSAISLPNDRIMRYCIMGNDVITYLTRARLEINDLSTGESICSDGFASRIVLYGNEEEGVHGVLLSTRGEALITFSLTAKGTAKHHELAGGGPFTQAQRHGSGIVLYSGRSPGYTKPENDLILSFDTQTQEFSELTAIAASDVVLYADSLRYVVFSSQKSQSERLRIHAYGEEEPLFSSAAFDDYYSYSSEAARGSLLFYATSGYDGESLETITLKKQIKLP